LISGHYVAFVYSTIDETWVLCDDHIITRVNLSEALDKSAKTCYLLVYEAVDEIINFGN
jgi:ubiquitin C-terminal hydrolase